MIESILTDVLREALLAVQDLRRKYLDQEQTTPYAANPQGCPLCNLDDSFTPDEDYDNCRNCPWWWFTGRTCEENDYAAAPISQRLARIDRWESALAEEIAARA